MKHKHLALLAWVALSASGCTPGETPTDAPLWNLGGGRGPILAESVYSENGYCLFDAMEGFDCWCRAGLVHDDSPIGFFFDQHGNRSGWTFNCVCANGSGDQNCDPGGGGDPPGDPEDPPHGGGGQQPLPLDTLKVHLTCSKGVTRGEPGGCSFTYTPTWLSLSGITWEFSHPDGTVTKSGGTEWNGQIVAKGDITLTVTMWGNPVRFLDSLTVSPRTGSDWAWGPSDWTLTPGNAGLATHLRDTEPLTRAHFDAGNLTVGAWCRNEGCWATHGFMRPDYTTAAGESGGFVLDTVAGGPNDGMVFVASQSYYSNTINAVHGGMVPTSTLTFSGMSAPCNNLNWYDGNICKGVSSGTLAALLQGIEDHEGRGTMGNNGHQSVAEGLALSYDPAPEAEAIVGFNTSWVIQDIESAVKIKRNLLEAAINSAGHPSGNFSNIPVYFVDTPNWVLRTISGG